MPAALRSTPVSSSNADFSRSPNSARVLIDVRSRGLSPRSAASISLTWASRARRASAKVLPKRSIQIPNRSGSVTSAPSNAMSRGEDT